jgi:hypothetical protein
MKRPASTPINDAPADLCDRDLLAAYQRTNGAPGDPEVEAIIAEIENRGLDI